MKKPIAIILSTIMLINLAVTAIPFAASAEPVAKKEETTTNVPNAPVIISTVYKQFLLDNAKVAQPTEEINIDLTSFIADGSEKIKLVDNYLGRSGKSLYTDEIGSITFKITAPAEGLYAMNADFVTENTRGASVERDIEINGDIQYKEAQNVVFNRLYENKKDEVGKKDVKGNDIKPSQVEIQKWQNTYLKDSQGYYNDPLLFKLKAGENIIKITSKSEPITFGSIKFTSIPKIKTYDEVLADYTAKGYTLANTDPIEIEAEAADFKSDPVLYPLVDYTTPSTQPYENGKTLLNTIGSSKWQVPRQFIVWNVNVKKAGLYNINIKERQSTARGVTSNRAIYIDNEIPFAEFKSYEFNFDSKWRVESLNKDDKPFMVYLSEGVHELKMDVTLGAMAEQINGVEVILKELNAIYTKIMIITGSAPDIARDYNLGKLIPEDVKRLGELAEELQKIKDWFVNFTGGKGTNDATLNTCIVMLRKMGKDADRIPGDLTYYKTNIGALGNWILLISQQPLELDYISITSTEKPTFKKPTADFIDQIVYDFTQFFGSFGNDYGSIGTSEETDQTKETIKVWIPTGRDQAQVLRKLIDNTFIPEYKTGVTLQLVAPGALLPATVAGIGPDVAINMGDAEPINYAIRNAVIDLKQFPDFETIKDRFLPERMVPITFDGAVYALPETQTYSVLFYRQDVLANLGLEVPNTWEDVIGLIPQLQKNNMNFSMPVSTTKAQGAGNNSYYTFLFQNGGEIFNKEGSRSIIDGDVGLAAFKQWTNLYSNYSLPQDYDFLTRFRTGEFPLIINDFSGFNTLAISAPEIRGLWSFTIMPGTIQKDGSINRTVPFGGTSCFIVKNSTKQEQSWNFLKWWTSAETQLSFGKEMESILGASARYATANLEAIKQIPWSGDLYNILEEQMQWCKGIQNVPGSYFISRHIDNAFRKVTISKADQKESISDYTYLINQELKTKRTEFGLE